jgi:phosphohistidine phosphatase
MELILWRHAEAEDHGTKPDTDRELTKKGRKQAERMAEWLRPRVRDGWRIVVSPAKRTLQTVEPLGLPFETSDAVGLAATARGLLREVRWPDGDKVLVVGHQPTLGEAVGLILTGSEGDTAIRKGAIWWFATREREGKMEAILKTVLDSEELKDPED